MSTEKETAVSEKDATLQTRFRLVGILILVAGLLAAGLIDRTAAPVDDSSDVIMPGNTKRYEYDLERMGGKSNVAAADFREWFGSLWHGRRLAHTLAVLSIAGCLACFLAAHVLTYPPPPESQDCGKEL